MRRCKSSVEDQIKMDMRLVINMDSYVDLDYKEKVEMSKVRAKMYNSRSKNQKVLFPRKFLLKKSAIKRKSESAVGSKPKGRRLSLTKAHRYLIHDMFFVFFMTINHGS